MDTTTLPDSSDIADAISTLEIDVNPSPADISRWMNLFQYNEHDARLAIIAHRKDPNGHVSDDKWRWAKWGHEIAGFNKETYEHLLVLKQLSKREETRIAKAIPLFEWVGDYTRICLEGILTLEILQRILGEDQLGTVGSSEKWCYIKHNTYHENLIAAWVKRWDRAVTCGSRAYNVVWAAALKERTAAIALNKAGFLSVPSSSQYFDLRSDLRVGCARVHQAPDEDWLQRDGMNHEHLGSPFSRLQPIHVQAELSRMRLNQPIQMLPLQRRLWGPLIPALPPWSQMSMRSLWEHLRTDSILRLPEFGNAPRVFPLPDEVVTVRVDAPNRNNTVSDSTAAPQLTVQGYHDYSRTSDIRGSQSSEQLFEGMSRPRSRTHVMEQLFETEFPATVSDMIIRELVVARSLSMEGSTTETEPTVTAFTTHEQAEV